MKIFFNLCIALLLTTSSFAQKQRIELNLTKGQTYLQHMVADLTTVQTMQGQDMTIKIKLDGKMSYQVVGVTDTVYQIACKYENLSMTMGLPTGNMEINSEGSDSNPMNKIMAGLKKYAFSIKLSKSGKVIEVKDIDKLFSGFSDIPGISAAQLEQLKAQLSQSYGEKAFKTNMEMSMAIYPGKAIQVGEKWVSKGQLNSTVEANLETVYTLKEVTDSYYLISGSSQISSTTDKVTETNGMKMKLNIGGEMLSEMKLSKKTGWIINGTITQKIKGTTEILPGGQLPEGMTIPMNINTTITITDQ